MFLNEAKKKIVHGIDDNKTRRIEIRKSQKFQPSKATCSENSFTLLLTFSSLESFSVSVTLCICMPLPSIAINVAISVFLPSAMTNCAKMIVAAGSKTGCFLSSWKIAYNAGKSTANQPAPTVYFCVGETDTRIPEVK